MSIEKVSGGFKTLKITKLLATMDFRPNCMKLSGIFLGDSLVASFNTAFESGNMSTSQKQAIITLEIKIARCWIIGDPSLC